MSTAMQAFYAEQEHLRQCYRDKDLEYEIQNERDAEKLAAHAHSSNAEIRSTVALNWHTPEATLRLLGSDPHADVRQSVAANLFTPTDVLEALAEEDTYMMRFSLSGNPSTPAAVDERIREHDPEGYQRARFLKAGGMSSRIAGLLREASA